MSSTEDALLVREILDGSVHRYAEVVQRYDAAVRNLLRSDVHDPGELEELVQETFYLAFRDLDQLRSPEQLRAWVLTIARRRLVDRRRRPKTRFVSLENSAEPTAPYPALRWLWEEVEKLPEAQARVLRLRYVKNLSYRRIAAAEGVPVSTIRGRLYEARRALRDRLSEN